MRSIANTLWNVVIPRKIERGSLRWKLTLGFAAVIGLTTCVGIIAVFSQIYARNIVSNLLDKNVRIADLSLQSDVAMLNAWRYEKELLVHHQVLGFDGRCKDGTYKWIQWNAVAVPSEQLIYATGRDVTKMKRAEDELEQKNKQLIGISHQAGMAEVATSVLHNVGNVLNSLSVSSALISEWVRESKVVNLSKVAALMNEHANDLGAFLTNDPNGKQVPFASLRNIWSTSSLLSSMKSPCSAKT
jgi:hypothetical protein